jgi:hypothetical protein
MLAEEPWMWTHHGAPSITQCRKCFGVSWPQASVRGAVEGYSKDVAGIILALISIAAGVVLLVEFFWRR